MERSNETHQKLSSLIDKYIVCSKCQGGRWHRTTDHGVLTSICCDRCNHTIPFLSGVFEFYRGETETLNEANNINAYSDYWDVASENYENSNYANEAMIISKFSEAIKGRTVCDLACGDGRLASKWASQNAEAVLFVDISEGIYQAAARYHRLKNAPPALFIRASVFDLPIAPKSIDFTWCAGLITLLEDQKKAVSEATRISNGMIMLGITSRNIMGRIYSALNVVRPLFSVLVRLGMAQWFFQYLAFVIKAYCSIMWKLKFRAYPLPLTTTEKIAQPSEKVTSIAKLVAEPFIAPKINREPDDFYKSAFDNNGFEINFVDTDMLMDYYLAAPKTVASR